MTKYRMLNVKIDIQKLCCLATVLLMTVFASDAVFAGQTIETKEADNSATKFTDVATHWAAASIERFAAYGVLSGSNGSFRPEDTITRAEFAVMLNQLMGYQEKSKTVFADVSENDWYAEAILKANAAGVLQGDGAGNALPTANVSREQAAVMLARALGVEAQTESTAQGFNDSGDFSSWSKGAVLAMTEKGYLSGMTNGAFAPKRPMTRAEIVSVLDRAITAYYDKPGTYKEDVSTNKGNENAIAIIRTADVVLQDLEIKGNLIIAEGVEEGEASLSGVTVSGELYLRGGGSHSIHILKGTTIKGKVRIEKIDGGIRLVSDGSVMETIFIEPDCEVLLEGDFTDLAIAEGVTVTLRGTAKNITVEGKAAVTVSADSKVASLTIEKAAEGSEIKISGKVDSIRNDTENTKVEVTEAVEEETLSGGGGGGGGGGAPGPVIPAEPLPPFTVTELSGNVILLTPGVYNVSFEKAVIETKFAGILTTNTLLLQIPGSQQGSYQAIYLDSKGIWFAYNIQGVSGASISAALVDLAE